MRSNAQQRAATHRTTTHLVPRRRVAELRLELLLLPLLLLLLTLPPLRLFQVIHAAAAVPPAFAPWRRLAASPRASHRTMLRILGTVVVGTLVVALPVLSHLARGSGQTRVGQSGLCRQV